MIGREVEDKMARGKVEGSEMLERDWGVVLRPWIKVRNEDRPATRRNPGSR
jgi:hypothetical protein